MNPAARSVVSTVLIFTLTMGAVAPAFAEPGPPPSLVPVREDLPPPEVPLTEKDRARLAELRRDYGSRFLCEAKREQIVAGWGLGGMLVGMAGGFYGARELGKKDGEETSSGGSIGMLVGMGVGWGVGWLLGRAVAPDCRLLPWTQRELEKMETYRLAQRSYLDCMKRRNWTIGKWRLGCGLGAGVAGGIAGAALAGDDGLARLGGALLGSLLLGSLGYLGGDLYGRSKAEDCGKAPRPEDIQYRPDPAAAPTPLLPSATVLQ